MMQNESDRYQTAHHADVYVATYRTFQKVDAKLSKHVVFVESTKQICIKGSFIYTFKTAIRTNAMFCTYQANVSYR